MAFLLEAGDMEEAKLPEEERTPRGVQLVILSETVKRTAPILGASNVALWAESDKLNVKVTHRESMRTFSAQLRADDLEQSGFDTRDSAEECVALIVDVLSAEESDTVAVTPMASPAEGSDTATASIKVPFSDCEFLRISFSIKMRTKLYEYSFVASEQKLDAATRTQLQLQSLKQKIEAQKAEIDTLKAATEVMRAAMKERMEAKLEERMETMKAQLKTEITADITAKAEMGTVKTVMEAKMEAMKAQSKKELDAMKVAMEESEEKTTHQIAALKSKGIASFRSNEMVGRFRKWNEVVLAPTLDAMGALSEDQSSFRIGMEGVYRVSAAVCFQGEMQSEWTGVQINGDWKSSASGGKCTVPVMSFVGRLRVGDNIKVYISAQEHNDIIRNLFQIEKL